MSSCSSCATRLPCCAAPTPAPDWTGLIVPCSPAATMLACEFFPVDSRGDPAAPVLLVRYGGQLPIRAHCGGDREPGRALDRVLVADTGGVLLPCVFIERSASSETGFSDLIAAEPLKAGQIPQPDSPISTGGGHGASVGGERHPVHRVGVAVQGCTERTGSFRLLRSHKRTIWSAPAVARVCPLGTPVCRSDQSVGPE
jgi:hypothetical protein